MRPPTPDPGRGRRHEDDQSDMRPPPTVDPRVHDALTDLYMYTLALDAERQGIEELVASLASSRGTDWTLAEHRRRPGSPHGEPEELVRLQDRRAQIASQLNVLWTTIDALRSQADSAGAHL